MHAPRLPKHTDRSTRTRPGWRAAITAVIAAGVLTVATCSPALAAANIITSSVSISPATIDTAGTATVTITIRNTGNVNAVVYVEAFVPSGLTATGSTALVGEVVEPGIDETLVFTVTPNSSATKKYTISVGFQSRNESAPEDTRNQMFLRFASVKVVPTAPCCPI